MGVGNRIAWIQEQCLPLDIIDINSFIDVSKLESKFAFFVSEGIGLVDLGILR